MKKPTNAKIASRKPAGYQECSLCGNEENTILRVRSIKNDKGNWKFNKNFVKTCCEEI